MHDDEPLIRFSRTGHTGTFGKNDRRLDIMVSEELENAIITMASLKGIPKSEFARTLIERMLFGEFSIVQKMAQRDGQ